MLSSRGTTTTGKPSPLRCSMITSLVLITTKGRPSPLTTISMVVSCGWRLLQCGMDVSVRRWQNHDAGGHRCNKTPFRRQTIMSRLTDRMKDYALLDVPKTVMPAGEKVRGTAAGIIDGFIVGEIGNKHRMRFPRLIISGVGSTFVSSSTAIKTVNTIEEGNPFRRKDGVVLPIQQGE